MKRLALFLTVMLVTLVAAAVEIDAVPITKDFGWTSGPKFHYVAAGTTQIGGADSATPTAQIIQYANSTGSNVAGVASTDIASRGTGTAASGNRVFKTGFSTSTGSTQHTAVDRHTIVAKGKALTDAAAVSLFEVALPVLKMGGGSIDACVQVTNGTDMQMFCQRIQFSAVNKAGAYTKSITASTGDKSVSAGTLTNTWTLLDGTNKVTVQLNSDTSLTPSGTNSFVVYYQVFNNSEQAITIL